MDIYDKIPDFIPQILKINSNLFLTIVILLQINVGMGL
jgi:hypothetical protein